MSPVGAKFGVEDLGILIGILSIFLSVVLPFFKKYLIIKNYKIRTDTPIPENNHSLLSKIYSIINLISP